MTVIQLPMGAIPTALGLDHAIYDGAAMALNRRDNGNKVRTIVWHARCLKLTPSLWSPWILCACRWSHCWGYSYMAKRSTPWVLAGAAVIFIAITINNHIRAQKTKPF